MAEVITKLFHINLLRGFPIIFIGKIYNPTKIIKIRIVLKSLAFCNVLIYSSKQWNTASKQA